MHYLRDNWPAQNPLLVLMVDLNGWTKEAPTMAKLDVSQYFPRDEDFINRAACPGVHHDFGFIGAILPWTTARNAVAERVKVLESVDISGDPISAHYGMGPS